MTHRQYITTLKVATIALMLMTPVFVYMDTVRLGYLPFNGAWITWSIPALLLFEVSHD